MDLRFPGFALLGFVLRLNLLTAAQGGPTDLGLFIIEGKDDDAIHGFVAKNIEPKHAVAVLRVGKGSKRHVMLEELSMEDALQDVLKFGVQFARGGSNLSVHLHRYPTQPFSGKWTKSAIRSWLMDVGYPVVNYMQYQFPPAKYLSHTSFGTVFIVKPLTEQSEALAEVLTPLAEKYKNRLKFTFFTKASGTKQLCQDMGVLTNDELLILEEPRRENDKQTHSHYPAGPKFRLEGVTPESVADFFEGYAAGTLPRYYKSSVPRSDHPVIQHGVRELTGWDFLETVQDPNSSVIVVFVSQGCDNCEEFAAAYNEVARRVEALKLKGESMWDQLVVARIDQSANEHTETIRGTPWMRYWPKGKNKKVRDVEAREIARIMNFLEDRLTAEAEGATDEL